MARRADEFMEIFTILHNLELEKDFMGHHTYFQDDDGTYQMVDIDEMLYNTLKPHIESINKAKNKKRYLN